MGNDQDWDPGHGEPRQPLHRENCLGVLFDRHAVFHLQQQAHAIGVPGIDGNVGDLADVHTAIRERCVGAQARDRLVHVRGVKIEVAGRAAGAEPQRSPDQRRREHHDEDSEAHIADLRRHDRTAACSLARPRRPPKNSRAAA